MSDLEPPLLLKPVVWVLAGFIQLLSSFETGRKWLR